VRSYLSGDGDVTGFGIEGYLDNAHVFCTNTAVVVHLVCPRLPFLDYGKSSIATLPPDMEAAITKVLWKVSKTLYREEEQRQKNAARAAQQERNREREQEREARAQEWTLKDAVFEVLPEAYEAGTGGGAYPLSVRDLYYEVRPRIQQYTNDELNYENYFATKLLPRYRQEHAALPLLYYKPRGMLYEPHTGEEIPLGTREVDEYQFPAWRYDKILYIEKSGMLEALKVDRLAERYDMAIVSAEGYASEAIRTLFLNANKDRRYKLFVLHDADPHGYNIARTLREATQRMPDYSVDVIDMGLKLEDALAMRLESEYFSRQNALPGELELNAIEQEWFEGEQKGKKTWLCRRVELNAIPVPDRVAYIEEQLERHGATEKVVPPTKVCRRTAEEKYLATVENLVEDEINRLLDTKTISARMKRIFRRRIRDDLRTVSRQSTREKLEDQRSAQWDAVLLRQIGYSDHQRNETIKTMLHAHLKERMGTMVEMLDDGEEEGQP
jgi:hypothetical protein